MILVGVVHLELPGQSPQDAYLYIPIDPSTFKNPFEKPLRPSA
jgi:hypothetical protein